MIKPSSLTGAVLSKELRVLSRQRRVYSLRVFYVLAVVVAVALMWDSLTRSHSYGPSGLDMMSARMDQIGRGVAIIVLIVQYAAVQLTAVGALSGALNAEVRRRTLYVLLATPMRAPQVVVGKLLAGLWLCLSLVALSVPLLMLIRVFGGVSLWPLIGGLAVTTSGAVLLGSVAMLWSGLCRQSWASFALTLVTWGVYEIGMMVVLIHAYEPWGGGEDILAGFAHFLPTWSLGMMVRWMRMPGGSWAGPSGFVTFYWPVACGLQLAIAAGLSALACVRVRALANPPVRAAAGAAPPEPPVKPADAIAAAGAGPEPAEVPPARRPEPAGPPRTPDNCRRVTGPPVIWHEARRALFGTTRQKVLAVLAIIGILAIPYGIAMDNNALQFPDFHVFMAVCYLAALALGAAVLAGAAIATERESQTLAVLLVSGVSSGQIVLGKAVGVLRRLWPVAIPFGMHVLLTWLGFPASPAWAGYLLVIAAGVLAVSVGCGLPTHHPPEGAVNTRAGGPARGHGRPGQKVNLLWRAGRYRRRGPREKQSPSGRLKGRCGA